MWQFNGHVAKYHAELYVFILVLVRGKRVESKTGCVETFHIWEHTLSLT